MSPHTTPLTAISRGRTTQSASSLAVIMSVSSLRTVYTRISPITDWIGPMRASGP